MRICGAFPNLHRITMNSPTRVTLIAGAVLSIACAQGSKGYLPDDANAGIDSLNARLVQAYRNRDPKAYGAIYTDSGVFEWPAFNTVRGRAALEALVQSNWAAQKDVDLRLTVASRRLADDHATEFGAFEQTWTDTKGARTTEFGRYVTLLARQPDRSWRIDRFFGFEDSTSPMATGR